MKNITLLFLTILLIGISACKNDDDNQVDCDEPNVIGFKNY
ncbi:MAG: hypothetical protein AB8H03_18535 [Saprospiraceae bacterium]